MTDVLAAVLAELAAACPRCCLQPMTEQAGWLTAGRHGGEPAPSS